jgi:tetratricopeptide (TPR) repeat protein
MTRALMARYPGSPLFLQIEQNCLFAAKDYNGLVRSTREYERRIKAGRPHFTEDHMPRVFVALGTMHMAQENLKSAREEFLKCLPYIGNPDRPNQWALWGLMRLAQVEDAMGDRESAKSHYWQVLPYKDFWGYRALARYHLKHPFQLDTANMRLAPPS